HCARHDPQADRQALRRLAVDCQQFTPVTAAEEAAQPESLLLDVTGCASFFKGEDTLACRVVGELRRRRYHVRAALADTIGAAGAVAHQGPRLSEPRSGEPVVVPSGGQKRALEPLLVEALRLSSPVLKLLHQFDLNSIGRLLALPREDIP